MPSNVLLIVWDACRYDAALECAPTLQELSSSGLWFENAVAPAPWTLPSHVSILSGSYPHEHGIYRPGDSPSRLPLLDFLDDHYNTYAVSGNPIFSAQSGFQNFFDNFYYTTPTVYTDGLNATEIYAIIGQSGMNRTNSMWEKAGKLLGEVRNQEHPFKSIVNLLTVAGVPVIRKKPIGKRIPHPRFNSHEMFSYSPSRNTQHIRKIINSEAENGRGFFLMANYMDTHRPYVPPKDYQQEYCNQLLSYKQLNKIDKNLADTWKHLERLLKDDISEGELNTLWDLYRGSVRSADDQLRHILNELEEAGVRDETLIIITADHGEALGRKDETGRRRVGHQLTVADDVLTVPLLVAHPNLDSASISECVSLKNIGNLIQSSVSQGLSTDSIVEDLTESGSPVIAEYPAKGLTSIYQRYPDVPQEMLKTEVSDHTVIAYSGGWKLVKYSSGDVWAGKNGAKVDPENVPNELHRTCNRHLEKFEESRDFSDVDKHSAEQLESLGYL